MKKILIIFVILILSVPGFSKIRERELAVVRNMVKNEMYEAAKAKLQQLIENNAEDNNVVVCYFLLGESYFFTKDYALAEKQYLKVYKILENTKMTEDQEIIHKNSLFRLGTINFNNKVYRTSNKYLQEFVDKYPLLAVEERDLGNDVKYYLAYTYDRLKDYDNAIKYYLEILKLGPLYGKKYFSEASYNIAWCYFEKKDYKEAIKHFKDVQKKKEYLDSVYYIAKSYGFLKNIEKALTFYDKVDPGLPIYKESLLSKANLLFDNNRKKEAADSFKDYYTKFPDDERAPKSLMNAAKIYFELKEYPTASRTFLNFEKSYSEKGTVGKNDLAEALYLGGVSLNELYNADKNKDYLNQTVETFNNIVTKYPDTEFVAKSYFKLGELYGNLNDDQKAIDSYKILIEKFTQFEFSDIANYEMAKLFFKKKDYANTIKYLNHFLDNYPKSDLLPDVRFSLAETYFLNEAWGDAIKTYSLIIEDKKIDKTKKEEAYFKLGWSLFDNKELEKSVGIFIEMEKLFPKTNYKQQIIKQIIRIYRELGKNKKAAEYIRKITDNKSKADLYIIFGEDSLKKNDFNSAVDHFKNALDIYKQIKDVETTLNIILRIGDIYYKQKMYKDLETLYLKAEKDYSGQDKIILVYDTLGWLYWDLKKYGLSAEYFNKIVAESDKRKDKIDKEILENAYYLVIRCYQNTNKDEDALKVAEKYLSLYTAKSKNYKLALYNKGLIEKKIDKIQDAIKTYRLFAEQYPDDELTEGVLFLLGGLFNKINKPDSAVYYFKKLVKKNPASEVSANSKFKLIEYYVGRKDNKNVIKYAKEITEKNKDFKYLDEVYYILGKYYEKEKNDTEAMASFIKLIDTYPKSDRYEETLFSYGTLLFRNSYNDKAQKTYEYFIKTYPQSKYAIDAYINLTDIFINKKEYKSAVENLGYLINNYKLEDIQSIGLKVKLAKIFELQGNYDKSLDILVNALDSYDDFIDKNPDKPNNISAEICIRRGDIFYKQKKYFDAIFEYQNITTVYRFKNYLDKAPYKEALCYIASGKKDKAKDILKKILTDFPETVLKDDIQKTLSGLK